MTILGPGHREKAGVFAAGRPNKIQLDYSAVSVKAAAMQFSLAHPAVAAVIRGASRPARLPDFQ
jgi:aryl-alcohol dehydrogenase-like predicted oxidoreductase